MSIFEKITEYDFVILNWIREYLWCDLLDIVMPVITFLGDAGWLWIALAVVMLCFKRTRKTAIMLGVGLVFGLVLVNLIIKPTVNRTRPFELSEIEGIKDAVLLLINKLPHDGSFPSGHTSASFISATVLMIRDKRFGIPALVIAVAIAFSRLYLYVHYPTDVLGGIVTGVICAVLGWLTVKLAYKKIFKEKA